MTDQHDRHIAGRSNVFSDLDLPDSDALLAKAVLLDRIGVIVRDRAMTQSQIARILGTSQPKVSDLLAGKMSGFSMERLIRYLNALDEDVRVVTSPRTRGAAVEAAAVTVPRSGVTA
jgi:predicted XRE-type DNA-binding protein